MVLLIIKQQVNLVVGDAKMVKFTNIRRENLTFFITP
ncbi:hypothetical protein HDC92_001262 [Pedobacter sp. AK017]|nr:hypothetical protein [Pedobacter sp. AK017]